MPAGTLANNTPSLFAAIGDLFNPANVPRMSIPCSTNVGESAVTVERLLAIKTMSKRHDHMLWVRSMFHSCLVHDYVSLVRCFVSQFTTDTADARAACNVLWRGLP